MATLSDMISVPSRKLEIIRRLARLALAWERLWRGLWRAATGLGIFAGLGMAGLWASVDPWVHAAALGATIVGAAVLLKTDLGRVVWPSAAEADRYLERRNGLAHRPLEALEDGLAAGDHKAAWQVHKERMGTQARSLRPCLPRPGVAAVDTWALRMLAVLALAVGLMVSGAEAPRRVLASLTPAIGPFTPPVTSVQVWITPPVYTGKPPRTMEWTPDAAATPDPIPDPIPAPEGSTVLALVHGGDAPEVRLGDQRHAMKRLGDGTFRLEATLLDESRMSVEDGAEVAAWSLTPIPDQPPVVTLAVPSEGPRWRLKLSLAATDDYGVTSAQALITLDGEQTTTPIELDLLPDGTKERRLSKTTLHDLTAHPWAGAEVRVQLVAQDARGQSAVSETARIRLPERRFRHPVARAIILQRKRLIEHPEATADALAKLRAIADASETYKGDRTVFLALTVARLRLRRDPSDTGFYQVLDILWRTALRLDEGGLAMAETAMNDAQRALEDALKGKASAQEVARLITDLEAAVQRYMAELAQELERRGAISPGGAAQSLDMGDLQSLLDRLRSLNGVGAREAARQMLDRLAQTLQSLRDAPLGTVPPQGFKEAGAALEELTRIAKAQEDLQRRSFARAQEQQDYNFDTPKDRARRTAADQADGAAQETLRYDLGAVMQTLGDLTDHVPENLSKAEFAMRSAVQLLKKGWPDEASLSQGQALDYLLKGNEEALAQISNMLSGLTLSPNGRGARDPLGRPISTPNDKSVKIPGGRSINRSRKILDELHRRAADPNRPLGERDYLRRLLKRF